MRAPVLFALVLALAAAAGFGWAMRDALQAAPPRASATELPGLTPAVLAAAPLARSHGPACSWRT